MCGAIAETVPLVSATYKVAVRLQEKVFYYQLTYLKYHDAGSKSGGPALLQVSFGKRKLASMLWLGSV